MKQYILPSESDATRVVSAMSRIVNDHGYVTVGELHDLIGLPHQFVDEKNGWRSTNHILHPADDGAVVLEFPDPEAIFTPQPAPRSIIRFVMEFDATPEVEKRLEEFVNATIDIRAAATLWSITKRPKGPFNGPRYSYSPGAYRGDDL